jgi:hypothetical protein
LVQAGEAVDGNFKAAIGNQKTAPGFLPRGGREKRDCQAEAFFLLDRKFY